MTSQFDFLRPEFPEIHALATRAEDTVLGDPRTACLHARLALETAVSGIYRWDRTLPPPTETTLAAQLTQPALQRRLGVALTDTARQIKDLGNRAAHDARPILVRDGVDAVTALFHVAYWLARTYARQDPPPDRLVFSAEALRDRAASSAARSSAAPEIASPRPPEPGRHRAEHRTAGAISLEDLPPKPAILIRITREWRPDLTEAQLYERVRRYWVLSPQRRKPPPILAYGVGGGAIRAVYWIESWETYDMSRVAKSADRIDQDGPAKGTRVGFVGRPAAEFEHLVGAVLTDVPKGQNPVTYLNC